MSKKIPADQAKLADQLGSDNAAAVAVFVDGRITAAVKGLREEISGLINQQAQNIETAEAEGSPEAAKVANEGTAAVVAADQAVEEAEADPTPEKAAAAAEAVEEAKEKVEAVESDLADRVAEIEETLAPWRKGEELGSRRPSRFDPIEQDMARLVHQVDQAETAYREAEGMVKASRGPALWIVALVTFVVALIIAGVFAIFTSLTFFWDAVWLAVATTAFVTIVTWVLEYGIPTLGKRRRKSKAEQVEDSEGLSIMEEQGASAH